MPRASILSLICCLSVALSSHTMAREPAAPTPVQDADTVAQITDLVMRYAVHRDAGEAQAYADLFTEDAHLSILGQNYIGRPAILARMRSAEPQTSMHLMGTIMITVESAERARGVSYAEVYIEPAAEGDEPVLTEGFAAIGIYHDRYRKTAQGWKIEARRFEPKLERATTP